MYRMDWLLTDVYQCIVCYNRVFQFLLVQERSKGCFVVADWCIPRRRVRVVFLVSFVPFVAAKCCIRERKRKEIRKNQEWNASERNEKQKDIMIR